MRWISGVLLWSMMAVAFSQQPNYYVLGEKEFANTDVYSLLQTEDGRLYAATDRGLFVYKHGAFQLVPGPAEQSGSALFNLTTDRNGEVFCGNFSGQVFKVKNGKLKLFLEVDKQSLFGRFKFLFDQKNRLIYASKDCLIYEEGEVGYHYSGKTFSTGGRLYQYPDGRICLATYISDSIGWVEDGKVRFEKLPEGRIAPLLREAIDRPVSIDNRDFIFHGKGRISDIGPKGRYYDFKLDQMEDYAQFAMDELWARGMNSGVRIYALKDGELEAGEPFYVDRFISAITRGRNGSYFLGTFGRGVMVVPNRDVLDQSRDFADESFKGIASDTKGGVFLTTQNGKLIHITNGEEELMAEFRGRSLPKIFNLPGIDFNLLPTHRSLLFANPDFVEKPYKISSVKDVYQVDSTLVLIAGAKGIAKIGEGFDGLDWEKTVGNWFYLKGLPYWSRAICYSTNHKLIYVATNFGIVCLDEAGDTTQVNYMGAPVYCNSMIEMDGQIWCGTQRNGILILEGKRVVHQIAVKEGGDVASILKLAIHDGKLMVLHDKGFQIQDLKNGRRVALGTAEGVRPGSVSDFAISGDQLWMISDNKPISIGLDQITKKEAEITVALDSLVVSGQRVDIGAEHEFSHRENSFTFFIDFKGLFYEDEAMIQSRIRELDTDWSDHKSSTSEVELKSLAPGSYTFEVRSAFRGEVKEAFTYKFIISPPFWQTWWFFTLLVLFVAAVAILIFQQYSRRQLMEARRQNELNSSKLTAIQSQMNPHFIFNALNSIQNLVLKGDVENSYTYITKFAKLVRHTLNHSDKDFIEFEQEIRQIEIYLALEKLRFKSELEYEVHHGNWEGLKVPPMLIQPFIENALVHGLFHKEGLRKLVIEFSLEKQLICMITDNGVGRKKAMEIRKRQRGDHQSFSINAIEKRFAILKQYYREEAGFRFEDHISSDGTATGTSVKLIIPVKRRL